MLHTVSKRSLAAIALSAVVAYAPAGNASHFSFSDNFEDRDTTTPQAEIGGGFVIGNFNHTTLGGWFAGLAAPNSGAGAVNGYSALVDDQGGAAQGDVQLAVFADYNDFGPWNGTVDNDVEFLVFRDVGVFQSDDAGEIYRFSYDAKRGDLDPAGVGNGPTTAGAFITILDANFQTVTSITTDTTNLTTDWSGGVVDVLIPADDSWDGYLMQIGFKVRGTEFTDMSGVQNWPPTTNYYDNINVGLIPIPAAVWLFGSGLVGLVGVARRRKG